MSGQAVRFDALRTLPFTSISGSFAPVGPIMVHNMRIIHFTNNTNADMIFSFDGVTNNVFVPTMSFVLYDLQTNSQTNLSFVLALNTQIYVKQSSGAASSGSVYVVSVYGQGQ